MMSWENFIRPLTSEDERENFPVHPLTSEDEWEKLKTLLPSKIQAREDEQPKKVGSET